MDTAGKDFFNKRFFDNHLVAIGDYPLNQCKWYSNTSDDEFDSYLQKNRSKISKELREKTKNILTTFDSDFLQVPICGDNKIKHHYEKIIWLIQEYCINGWKNPLKAINLLDNGELIIHPGTNRCAAAKLLKCPTMPVMINYHRKQKLASNLDNFKVIDNEKDLRNTLTSNGDILWRTESTENLFIEGKKQRNEVFQEFTFEFTHRDSWPESDRIDDWSEIVEYFLPLQVYVTGEKVGNCVNKNAHLVGKKFTNRTNGREIPLTYNLNVETNNFDYSKPWIKIDDIEINFDIFELLFFINPYHQTIKTGNSSIVINNPRGKYTDSTPIIPEHYVRP